MKKLILLLLLLIIASPAANAGEAKSDYFSRLSAIEEGVYKFIDADLLPSYKRGEARKKYIRAIAEEAAMIEVREPGMGFFVLAMARKESSFRLVGNRKSSAAGLCQVILRWHKATLAKGGITRKDLLENPAKSLRAGYLVLKSYHLRTNDLLTAFYKYRGLGSKGITQDVCDKYFDDILGTFGEISDAVAEEAALRKVVL